MPRLFRFYDGCDKTDLLKNRRNLIARMRRKFGAVKVQDTYHGLGHYSVQIFAGTKIVADLDTAR